MKVAWITGGGSGIGRALARELSLQGWRVAISGRRAEAIAETAQLISKPDSVLTFAGDVSDDQVVTRTAKIIRSKWGEIDLLVNNAGVNPNHNFVKATPNEFMEVFKINCMSALLCTRAVLGSMRKRRSGSIVNISSVLGKWASVDSPAYSVSKYALTGFTDSLRPYLQGTGVHLMGVYPGFIRTAMTQPFVKKGSMRDRMGKTPEQMAHAILEGLRKQKSEVNYPWYVPVAVKLHALFPTWLERLRKKVGH